MAIHLKGFAGEVPRVQPRYLPDQAATLARNVRLDRGDIEPINASTLAHTPPGARASFYKHGDDWLTFTDATTRVVPGPVATDRLYLTRNSGGPTMLFNDVEYPLALAKPVGAPVVNRTGTLDPELQEIVLYAFTWVTAMGEESQPSPMAGIMWSPGCTVTLSGMPVAPNGRNITAKRIYRSQTSASGATELFFVAQVVETTVSWTHDLETHPLAEPIPSTDYDPPPSTLRGITAMPNGMMAAFSGREVLFCEPYQPHAWPQKYRLAMTEGIVALAAFGTTLAVLTKGQPSVVQGLHPEAMATSKLEQPFPCVAALGVVDMGYAAVYPSTDGLVEITQGGARVLTEATWTRQQWADLTPATFIAAAFNGRYVFSHVPAGGSRQMGALDLRTQPVSLSRIDLASPHMATDLATGRCYYLIAGGTAIHELDPLDSQSARTVTWRSKPFYMGRPQTMGAIYVEATVIGTGDGVRVIADGVTIETIPPTRFNRMVRLPAGRFSQWEIEVSGTSTITRISIGQTPDEVRL